LLWSSCFFIFCQLWKSPGDQLTETFSIGIETFWEAHHNQLKRLIQFTDRNIISILCERIGGENIHPDSLRATAELWKYFQKENLPPAGSRHTQHKPLSLQKMVGEIASAVFGFWHLWDITTQ
jgi:hypothetical protein